MSLAVAPGETRGSASTLSNTGEGHQEEHWDMGTMELQDVVAAVSCNLPVSSIRLELYPGTCYCRRQRGDIVSVEGSALSNL